MRKNFILFFIWGILFVSLYPVSAQTWSAPQRLTWISGVSQVPRIFSDDNDILHLVWYDDAFGSYDIFYKQSINLGTTWSAPKRLTWTSGTSSRPTVAVDSTWVLFVVYGDDTPGNAEVFLKRSFDASANWSAPIRLTWNPGGSYFPEMLVDPSDMIHIFWQDDSFGNNEILYKSSTDKGTTWSGLQRLTWNPGISQYPIAAAGPGADLYMVWNDDTTGNHEIYFKKSTDSGSTWGVIKRLNWMTDYSTRPVIAVDSTGNIYLVWNDHMPGNNEIYFKKSTDGGTTWAPPRRLTWNLDESSDPALVIDSNDDLHLFWSDESAGFSEIYYRISTDNGTTWSARQRLTYMPGYSYRPEAVVDSNDYLHLVWYDNTPAYTPDYNEEIYYKNRK